MSSARPRVLLIGNAPQAAAYPIGHLIDAYEGKVVRFNLGPVGGEYAEQLGTRTDCWATCGGHRVRDLGQREVMLTVPDDLREWSSKDWQALVGTDLPATQISRATYASTKGAMRYHPSSGALVAAHYLAAGAQVDLYGFNFHDRSTQHHYWEPGRHRSTDHDHGREKAWFSARLTDSALNLWQPQHDPDYLVARYTELYASGQPYDGHAAALYTEPFLRVMRALRTASFLDYGCGRSRLAGVLAAALKLPPGRAHRFDPALPDTADATRGIDGIDDADLVYTTDVLEHVPLARLPSLLAELRCRGRDQLHAICLRPAALRLSDGQNAHATVRSPSWWGGYLSAAFPRQRVRQIPHKHHDVAIFLAT